MISNTKKFLTGMVIALVFASCTPRLAGSWAVQRYENSRPGQKGVSLNNIGTIRFYKNGKGEKNVNYTVLGINHKDQNPFRWTSTDGKYVTIDGRNSEFSKTWIIISNKKKYQKWKSTDGDKGIQVLELKK